jgi:hypothetical protein
MKASNGIRLEKDQLLARVLHSIELTLFQLCIIGVGYLRAC